MRKHYTISNNPELWGSDATEAEAEAGASRLAAAIEDRFGVEVRISDAATELQNADVDPDGVIRQWVSDNWTEFC
jgi:predicted lipoprotein